MKEPIHDDGPEHVGEAVQQLHAKDEGALQVVGYLQQHAHRLSHRLSEPELTAFTQAERHTPALRDSTEQLYGRLGVTKNRPCGTSLALQANTSSLILSTTELSNICGDLWRPPWYLLGSTYLPSMLLITIMAIICFLSTDWVTVESSYLPWLPSTGLGMPLWPRSS